ncbi:MAG TPA: P-loop NTPase [Solirubrobacterales bacterium]
MELTGNLRLIWASKRWLALFAVVAAVVVYAISSSKSDEYESNALGQIVTTSQAAGEILNEEQLLSLSNLYEELAKTRSVIDVAHEDPAIKGREEAFDASIEVQPEARTGVMSFSAITGNPEESAEFANAYAEAFSRYLGGLSVTQQKTTLQPIQQRIDEVEAEINEGGNNGTSIAGLQVELQALQDQIAEQSANPGDTMRVIEHAVPQSTPVAPTPKRDAILALIGALVLGAVAIYLRDLFFDRYGSAQEAARDLGLTLLGEIPKGRGTPAVESFRNLRTATMLTLERASGTKSNGSGTSPGSNAVLVTGAESGCGKSYVAANIARALAAEGRRVTAVDGDLRRPTLHEIFNTSLSPGLSDMLVVENAPEPAQAAVKVSLPPDGVQTGGALHLLPAGAHAEDAVESLSSTRMKSVVQYLRADNDVVVFDTPPALVVVDPVVLARYADGVVFVVDSRRTSRRDARRAVEALRAIGAPMLGFAFNRSNTKQTRYDAYRTRDMALPTSHARETAA